MSEIQKTLAERATTYGSFKDVATLSQSLQATMRNSKNWGSMQNEMREALQTISSKIARILNGDPEHVDSWHDIAGYATLVEKSLGKHEAVWPDDARIDVVGQNGNTGEHYNNANPLAQFIGQAPEWAQVLIQPAGCRSVYALDGEGRNHMLDAQQPSREEDLELLLGKQ